MMLYEVLNALQTPKTQLKKKGKHELTNGQKAKIILKTIFGFQ